MHSGLSFLRINANYLEENLHRIRVFEVLLHRHPRDDDGVREEARRNKADSFKNLLEGQAPRARAIYEFHGDSARAVRDFPRDEAREEPLDGEAPKCREKICRSRSVNDDIRVNPRELPERHIRHRPMYLRHGRERRIN